MWCKHTAKKLVKILTDVSLLVRAFFFILQCTHSVSQAGRKKNMGKLLLWLHNIVNHFWYCARTCGGDVALLKVSMCHYVLSIQA